jgi:YkoY family integral membrane protein
MTHLALGDFPLVVMTVLWLVFLEGLLSADNALVLAMMVRHLPKHEQKRALRYGIWGAFAFRLVAVLLAKVLLDFWLPKVAGGLYLLYLAVAHFLSRTGDGGKPGTKRLGSGFWATVASVELADIAFSLDSILAAVALAEGLPPRFGANSRLAIVITGGVLGIITMRFVAGYFILLLERFRGLEPGAYGLVAWIGLKLLSGGLHTAGFVPFEMNEWFFWGGMAVIALGALFYRPRSGPPVTADEVEEVTRIAEGLDVGDGPDPDANGHGSDAVHVVSSAATPHTDARR